MARICALMGSVMDTGMASGAVTDIYRIVFEKAFRIEFALEDRFVFDCTAMSDATTTSAATPSGSAGLSFPDDARTPRDRWMWRGVLLLLVLVAYSPAIQGGFIWDDPRHVTDNKALRSADGLWRIWFRPSTGRPETYTTPQYYPLTHTSYWIEYQLWGPEASGYH